ncbi:MAG: hypothetical protein LBU32_17000 [Clostridiales bacterium]|nr:hypothetical protein [Clostridiales bacterium]
MRRASLRDRRSAPFKEQDAHVPASKGRLPGGGRQAMAAKAGWGNIALIMEFKDASMP